MVFRYLVDMGYGWGRVSGSDFVGFRVVDLHSSGAWWLVPVLVAELFAVLKFGRALVLPMAFLFAAHAAAFRAAVGALFLS